MSTTERNGIEYGPITTAFIQEHGRLPEFLHLKEPVQIHVKPIPGVESKPISEGSLLLDIDLVLSPGSLSRALNKVLRVAKRLPTYLTAKTRDGREVTFRLRRRKEYRAISTKRGCRQPHTKIEEGKG